MQRKRQHVRRTVFVQRHLKFRGILHIAADKHYVAREPRLVVRDPADIVCFRRFKPSLPPDAPVCKELRVRGTVLRQNDPSVAAQSFVERQAAHPYVFIRPKSARICRIRTHLRIRRPGDIRKSYRGQLFGQHIEIGTGSRRNGLGSLGAYESVIFAKGPYGHGRFRKPGVPPIVEVGLAVSIHRNLHGRPIVRKDSVKTLD